MKRSKLEKQKEAEQRASHRLKRSHKDQLALLDSKFGKDQGASKERARLKSLIEGVVVKEEKVEKKKRKKKEVQEGD